MHDTRDISGQPVPEPDSWTYEADVVVLGSGGAGMLAAIEAAEMDVRTVVLEGQPELGGSTRLSGGYVSLCETELVSGRREALLEDLDEAHHHDSHFELSRVYVDSAADTYRRLQELGVEFVGTMQFAHMSQPWAHEPGGIGGGAEIIGKLQQAAVRRQVEFRASTRATALVMNAAGRIVGVVAQTASGQQSFHARKAVVLATGGFTRNPDLIKRYGREEAAKFLPITGKGSLGDGLKLGLGVEAATSYLEVGIAPTGPVDPVSGGASLVNYKGAILVNKEGKRFCRESDVYLDLSWAGVRQTGQLMIQVYDSEIRADYLNWRLSSILGQCQEHSASTMEQLAARLSAVCGMDAAALVETVAGYNRYVDNGYDPDFGRGNLVGSAGALRRIEKSPFFATVLKPGTTHFNGGLRVNRNMQVLRKNGDVIPGLYAAGEITGGFHGTGYMSGTFVGSALIFGRIAGKNAADERRAWGEQEAGNMDVSVLS